MAASLYNLARMTTGTTGAGTITLGSAVSGFLSFSAAGVSNGETVTYAIQDGTASEIGRGVYTASGTTLTRSVLKSTNSNAAISLSGSAQVFITAAAEDFSVRTTAETTFGTDNRIVRSDGTGRGVQSSAITIDDSGNVAGVVNQTMTGYADITEISAPSAPASNVARLYAVDDGGVTRVAYKDSGGQSRYLGAVSTTLRVADYGAAGDNATNDTAALNAAFAACPAYGVIDLAGATYRITAPLGGLATGVTVRNGRIRLDSDATSPFYAITASDYCTFDAITFLGSGVTGTTGTPKYQGGILAGNTSYSAPMDTEPADYVTVRGCTFQDLTVGVWVGGSSPDPVPVGWRVEGNAFVNIVGLAGESEGYGVLFTPANNGVIAGNTFTTIQRHAVYIASEASNNVIADNVISGCDNIAIQSNTSASQDYADRNIYTGNVISGFTRSISYGYRSSIGIGIYGKHSNTLICNNLIYDPLDTGIDVSGELSTTAYGSAVHITGNHITLDSTATDAGIRVDGVLSGTVNGNRIKLQAGNYGVIVLAGYGTGTEAITAHENTIETTSTSAVAFRVALSAARVLRIARNYLNGFQSDVAYQVNDTSTAGRVTVELGTREVLTANRTYYVRTDGSDSNTGRANTAAGAFLTVQKAIDVVSSQIDTAGYTVTISIGAGTYSEGLNLKSVFGVSGTASAVIKGATGTASDVTISASGDGFAAFSVNTVWLIKDLTITSSGGSGISVSRSWVTFSNVAFGSCAVAHLRSTAGGRIRANGAYSITGGALWHAYADEGSQIVAYNFTVTLTGTPAFSSEFVRGYHSAYVQFVSITFSGAATGTRYYAAANAVIDTSGGGATYLPGNASGSTATGGQYV